MAGARIERYDAVIVGGGIVGSSLAMALSERRLKTIVVDLDLSGRLSSSEKNAGGVRATWWQPVNISLCRAGIRYYETIRDEVGFRQKGYLWLYDAATWAKALGHLAIQRHLGHPIEELSPRDVNHRVPEIDKLDEVAGATFSPADGLINPNLLKTHYRNRSVVLGAKYLDRIYVYGVEAGRGGVYAHCWQGNARLTDSELARFLSQDDNGEPERGRLFEIEAETVVIAAGAWSPNVLRMVGLESPTDAVRRQICVIDNRSVNLAAYGMIVDASGVYFHNDGPYIMAGYSTPEEPAGYSFRYDSETFFQNEVWPRLFARMSAFERLRHITGWAGLYAVTPDRSAIIGRAASRIFEAHSFSGRGVMQSYGAGQALAALIATGVYGVLDADALSRDRFTSGRLVTEHLHI